ncbi:hypothetical protein PIB30_099763, partial [Stylosanthes scabra]|nr:hypothetical protein [Stylosanthes scabra]
SQKDEDEFYERSNYHGYDDRSAMDRVLWAPPEPPDLYSLAVGDGAPAGVVVMAEAIARTPEDLKEEEIGVRSGAEDGAVAKDNMVDADLIPCESKDVVTTSGADEAIAQSRGHIFNDSAAAKSERILAIIDDIDLSYGGSASHDEDRAASSAEVGGSVKGKWKGAITTVSDRGLQARRLRRFVLLNPPPLLAAVFPRNRGDEREE